MQIFTGEIKGHTDEYPLSRIGSRSEILGLDIETTGLSPEHAAIWLIGCAYREDGHWQYIQWFDETGEGEADILTSFLLFAKRFHILLHYNGSRFDLPFLERRIVHNGLQAMSGGQPFPGSMTSVDLLKILRPYQYVLSLPDLRQQTVENFLGTGRTESLSGKEIAAQYQTFLRSGETDRSDLRRGLLEHNAADLSGLIGVSDILAYEDLFHSELTVSKAQANVCRDASGQPAQELILHARIPQLPCRLPAFTTQADSCYLNVSEERVTIRVPIHTGRLHYYYDNYRDYYYLPALDQAVHKSIAAHVDGSHRVQATRETCYTAKDGSFLPQWSGFREPLFQKEFRDRTAWFEFTPELKKDRAFFTEYGQYVYRHILQTQIMPQKS